MPSHTEKLKADYAAHARAYNDSYPSFPNAILESQLVVSALGPCPGLTVLDLGGGNGARALQALDLGAAFVDVVDLSPAMLLAGQQTATHHGSDRVAWHEADVSQPLTHLPLRGGEGGYDLVMANWVLDHAGSLDELAGMWRNIGLYLAPGGRFIGVRGGDPYAACTAEGKYGMRYKDWRDVPGGGGVFFRYEVACADPPIDVAASSWEVMYSGSTEMMEKVGIGEVETEPYENAEIVRGDAGFWKLFLENPSMVVMKGRKLVGE